MRARAPASQAAAGRRGSHGPWLARRRAQDESDSEEEAEAENGGEEEGSFSVEGGGSGGGSGASDSVFATSFPGRLFQAGNPVCVVVELEVER